MKHTMSFEPSTQSDQQVQALIDTLGYLKLPYMREHYRNTATTAADKHWDHVRYLSHLAEAEAGLKQDRATERRIRLARFPIIKTLDAFQWNWPEKINRLQIQHLFRLDFIKDKGNVILLGGVGLGKTHLAIALGHQACLKGHSVLFVTAIDVINALAAAQAAGRFMQEMKKYTRPALLVLDELGYLPIDKPGADLLFQVISHRYEQGAMVITSNRAFKDWPEIFNHDSTLTSALLDRLLHHSQTAVIEGKSFRMKDVIEE